MTYELPPAGGSKLPEELSPKVANRKPLIIAAIAIMLVLVAFCGLGIFLFNQPETTSVLRDIFIILLAVETLLIALIAMALVLALFYIILKISDLVYLINHEVKPLVQKADDALTMTKDTARIVQNRAAFIGDEAVKPVLNILSTIAAIKAVLRSLFGRS
jgi:predicted membrane protein